MKEQLRTVLALDSLTNYLHFYERMKVHRFINQNKENINDLPVRVRQALEIIKKHNWNAPELKLNQDRMLRFRNEEHNTYRLITNYQHPILTEIKRIK